MWKDGDSLPYRGYYNGNVKMMIGNGTYEDFRPKLLISANMGKFATIGTPEERKEKSLAKIEEWDKQWAAIPLEERVKRRNLVADNSAIREEIRFTARGPLRVLVREPEDNDNLSHKVQKKEKRVRQNLPTGSITRDNMPDALRQSAQKAAASVS